MSGGISVPPGHVKLVSSDGFEYVIDDSAARVSSTIRGMLDSQGNFTETESRTVTLPDIPSHVLEKCCEYFYYKLKYTNTASKDIPEFKIRPEMALELLMAANYLDA